MYVGSTDQKVLGYLGRSLSLELSAVQLYSTQASLVASWGLDEVAERFRREAHEEMQHAERIIARMLALGAAPNASQLRPVRLGQDLRQLLQYDYMFENELIGLYEDAIQCCARAGDNENRLFFEGLLKEEESHARELEHQLKQLE